MKKWKQSIIALAAVVGIGMFALPAPAAHAINVFSGCSGQASDSKSVCGAAKTDNATHMARNVINVMLTILGIVAVIMIVIGGMRYVLSGGDSSSVTSAKNTILYSVIGLVVAVLAFAIVNFVITAL